MPRVQNYGGQQVRSNPLPSVRPTATPSGRNPVGEALYGIGLRMVEDETARQDQIAVMEADRKLSDWETQRLYDPKQGALNRRGKDAFGLPDEVGDELNKTIGDIRGSLANDRQRLAFDRQASARRTSINTTLSRHVFGEIRKHDDTETENYLATARQLAVANAHDPDRVSVEIERQQAAVLDYASRNGLGPEYVKQKVAQVHSNTHMAVIDRLLSGGQDLSAKKYFETNRAFIAGDDIGKVEKALEEGSLRGEAQRRVDAILSPKPVTVSGAAAASADMPRLTQVVMSIESGGNRYGPDGKLLTSPKGAKGEMQVMDGTNRDPGYGVTPAKDDSPEERARVGRDYLAAMHREFGGDAAKAMAAYNAGPDAVKKAVAKAGNDKDWLKHMPAETQEYVVNGLTKLGVASEAAKRTTAPTLESALEEARAITDPKLRDEVTRRVTHEFELRRAAERERKEQVMLDAVNIVEKQGVQAIPPSVWASLSLTERSALQQYERRDANVATDPETYYTLVTMASSPELQRQFLQTNLLQYVGKLSKSDLKQVMDAQAALRKGDRKEADKLLASEKVQSEIVNGALLTLGLDPTPNERTPKDKREKVVEFRRVVRETVRAREERTGKPATDADVQSIVDDLIVKGKVPGTGWVFDDTKHRFELKDGETMVIKPADVPRAERLKIEDAMRRLKIPITDQAVVDAYTRKLGLSAKPAQSATKPEGGF